MLKHFLYYKSTTNNRLFPELGHLRRAGESEAAAEGRRRQRTQVRAGPVPGTGARGRDPPGTEDDAAESPGGWATMGFISSRKLLLQNIPPLVDAAASGYQPNSQEKLVTKLKVGILT